MIIYEDNELYIETEQSEIPWLKIFTKEPYRELGDVPKELRMRLWEVFDVIEDDTKKINLEQLDDQMKENYSNYYLGCIHYDESSF